MGTINVTLGNAAELNLILGQQLENEVNQVVFDFSAWKTAYGSGDIDLSVQRHGDAMPYPVTLTVSGTDATWTITDTDTACKGIGEAQVTYKVGDVVKKSVVYKFTVYRSIGENGEYPAPGSTWCDQVEQDIADIKADLGDLTDLETTVKTDLVSAINEVYDLGSASGGIEVVSSVSEMTNVHACYLLNTDGHWYYYDGAEWVDGGEFSGSSASLEQIASVIKRMIVISTTEPSDSDVILWINPDDANNYTTATQVQNMINTALGVIENGSY